jgi:Domain of unknown function (DUF4411)
VPDFWLDANIFISSHNGPYGFDIAPGFWAMIEQKAVAGVVASSMLVYDELVSASDDLRDWVRDHKDTLFIAPDELVQRQLTAVGAYVQRTYGSVEASKFLAGADPWLIAHAKVHGGAVVTHEVKVPASSKKVKIPNVCEAFGVPVVNPYEMLRRLGMSLS